MNVEYGVTRFRPEFSVKVIVDPNWVPPAPVPWWVEIDWFSINREFGG